MAGGQTRELAAGATASRVGRPKVDSWWAAGLGLAALLLYLATLAPTVATVFDDSLEFQIVLPSLGIAHPTGYPLYTLLGWLFSLLPVGDPAYRVNLLSALAGAVTVGLLFLVARRLGSSRLAATTASLVFALGTTWWSQATIAEVYTLHGLFVALILLLTLQGDGTRKPWLALVIGLSLAHHRTTLLLLPGVLVYLLWNDPGVLRRPRQLAGLILAGLLPLLLYLYLPLRGLSTTSLDGTYTNTWSGFWRHVLASDYRAFLTANPLAIERSEAYPVRLMAEQMGLAGLLLGLFGWLRWPEQPRRWTMLALVFLANVLFAAGYRTADADVFYLPATMVWMLIASAGLTLLLDQVAVWLANLGRRLHLPGPYKAWLTALQLIVVAVVLAQPLQATARVLRTETQSLVCAGVLAVGEAPALNPNRAGNWNASNCGHAMLEQPLPDQARLVGLLGETSLVKYLQMAEGLRLDVVPVTADAEPARLEAVRQELAAGHAVYLTRELPGAAEGYVLTAQGPLIRVLPAGEAQPVALAQPVNVPFGDSVRLTGYQFSEVPARGSTWARLEVAWQAESPLDEDLKVSARLLDAAGQVMASADQVPVHWAYPTTAWRPGETVVDAYDFALPAGTQLSALTPLVILYRAADGSEVGRFQP